MKVVPYLTFRKSADALDFYKQLGATDVEIVYASDPLFDDDREEMNLPVDMIMNAGFKLNGQLIYCSDSWDDRPVDHRDTSVAFEFDANNEADVDWVKKTFAKALSIGATEVDPLGETSWAKLFGMFDDPFGVTWIFSSEE